MGLLASFSFTLVVLFVKILNDYGVDAYGASFWQYAGITLPSIPLFLYYEYGPRRKKQQDESLFTSLWPIFKNQNWKTWAGLVSRGMLGSGSMILRYYSLRYLTIVDTTVIIIATPALVTVLAHFFLGERCGVFPVLVAVLTLCGIAVVIKPPILTGASGFDTDSLIGAGLACGSMICLALAVIVTRKIRKVHFTVMLLGFGIVGVSQALILIYFLGELNLPTKLYDGLLLGGVSGFSFLGQLAMVLALKFEEAGPIALVRSCDVLFGFGFQFIFLHVALDIFSAVAAAIILTAVLSIGFRRWLSTLPQDDIRRRRWCLVLK